MAVTFAMYTSHPALLGCQLKRLEGEAALHDGEPLNALGVGSYAQEDVLLQRQPTDAAPATVAALTPAEASEALLYQAQLLPATVSLEESAAPFRFRRWLFMFDGSLPGLEDFRPALLSTLPPYLRRQIGAETGGEAAFALFLKQLRDTGRTDDRRLEARVAAELLGKAARSLLQASAKSGAVHAATANLVASNSQLLVAARLGPEPLYYKLLEGSGSCDVCRLAPGGSEIVPEVRAHLRSRAVAVASHLKKGARWLELPSGSALAVGPTLQPDVIAI